MKCTNPGWSLSATAMHTPPYHRSENGTVCLPLGVSLAQSPRTRLESQAEGERQWILVPFPLQDLSFRKFPRSHQFREMSPFSLPKERQGAGHSLNSYSAVKTV